MNVLRLLAVGYWLLVSLLLLVPNPAALLFGLRPAQAAASMRGVHGTAFLVLALLVQAARFPLRRSGQWALLVGYALLVESLQWFVPRRTVELADYAENLLGLALGAALFAAVSAWGRRSR
jgi:hypothetical protein